MIMIILTPKLRAHYNFVYVCFFVIINFIFRMLSYNVVYFVFVCGFFKTTYLSNVCFHLCFVY